MCWGYKLLCVRTAAGASLNSCGETSRWGFERIVYASRHVGQFIFIYSTYIQIVVASR